MQTVLKPPLNTTQKSKTITTSLYELIETVQREIGSENDKLGVKTNVRTRVDAWRLGLYLTLTNQRHGGREQGRQAIIA